MTIRIPGRVVVFDYGEVISRSPSDADRAAVEHAAGVDAEPFWPAYWRHRDALDHGRLSTHDYWKRIADDLGTDWSDSHIHQHWITEMGKLKPSADIYLDVAAELAVTPDQLIFIDNKATNVEGAEALGVTGHVFTDAAGLRTFLTTLADQE